MPEEMSGVSRRTIVKGAAWSVPVIATAAAVPGAAASGRLSVGLTISGDCVAPGGALPDAAVAVTDESGPVTGATVTLMFSSSNGGEVTIGGKTYPTESSTLTLAVGETALRGVVAKTAGTVLVTATAKTSDGRSATSTTQAYEICVPQTSTLYQKGPSGEVLKGNPTTAAGPVRLSGVGAVGNNYASFLTTEGKVYITGAANASVGYMVNIPTGLQVKAVKYQEGGDYGWGIGSDGKIIAWGSDINDVKPSLGGDGYTYSADRPWVVGRNYVTALSESGEVRRGNSNTAFQTTTIPGGDTIKQITTQQDGDNAWMVGETGGVYYTTGLGGSAVATKPHPDGIESIAPGREYVPGITKRGEVVMLTGFDASWTSVTGLPAGVQAVSLTTRESSDYWYILGSDRNVYGLDHERKITQITTSGDIDSVTPATTSLFLRKKDNTWWWQPGNTGQIQPLLDGGTPITARWIGVTEGNQYGWALA